MIYKTKIYLIKNKEKEFSQSIENQRITFF